MSFSGMAAKNQSNSIPDGWFWDDNLSYKCQATGQHFPTYEALMRYVTYAKAAKVSMYSPKFGSNSVKKSGCRMRMSRKSSKSVEVGECSKFAARNQNKVLNNYNESMDLDGNTDLGEPAENPNEKGFVSVAKDDPLPHQAGLEGNLVQVSVQIADQGFQVAANISTKTQQEGVQAALPVSETKNSLSTQAMKESILGKKPRGKGQGFSGRKKRQKLTVNNL